MVYYCNTVPAASCAKRLAGEKLRQIHVYRGYCPGVRTSDAPHKNRPFAHEQAFLAALDFSVVYGLLYIHTSSFLLVCRHTLGAKSSMFTLFFGSSYETNLLDILVNPICR